MSFIFFPHLELELFAQDTRPAISTLRLQTAVRSEQGQSTPRPLYLNSKGDLTMCSDYNSSGHSFKTQDILLLSGGGVGVVLFPTYFSCTDRWS